MANDAFLLVADNRAWKVARLGAMKTTWRDISVEDEQSVTTQVQKALVELHYEGSPCLLAIGSSWCLSATIKASDLSAADHDARLYRLEEKLPLAAEDVVAGFLVSHDAQTALGVAVRIQALKKLVDDLESAGIVVQSVTPADVLLCQQLEHPGPDRLLAMASLTDPQRINLFTTKQGIAVQWAACDRKDLLVQADILLSHAEVAGIAGVGVSLEDIAALESHFDTTFVPVSDDALTLMANGAGRVLQGERAWIELRRGPVAASDRLRLYRRPLNLLLASVAVLMVCMSISFLMLAHRYQRVAAVNQSQLEQQFTRAFPDWPRPDNIALVVASEHRKAAAIMKPSAAGASSSSGLRTLRLVLSSLPTARTDATQPSVKAARYAIARMSAEPDSFEVDGQMASYEDGDALAAAARATGLHIPPVVARRAPGGLWTFILTGARPTLAEGAQ